MAQYSVRRRTRLHQRSCSSLPGFSSEGKAHLQALAKTPACFIDDTNCAASWDSVLMWAVCRALNSVCPPRSNFSASLAAAVFKMFFRSRIFIRTCQTYTPWLLLPFILCLMLKMWFLFSTKLLWRLLSPSLKPLEVGWSPQKPLYRSISSTVILIISRSWRRFDDPVWILY